VFGNRGATVSDRATRNLLMRLAVWNLFPLLKAEAIEKFRVEYAAMQFGQRAPGILSTERCGKTHFFRPVQRTIVALL
jgi:hypothetical protein